jgi:hypothetical protein
MSERYIPGGENKIQETGTNMVLGQSTDSLNMCLPNYMVKKKIII